MKKLMVIAVLLLSVFVLTMPIRAAQEEEGQPIKQKITKQVKAVEHSARVLYKGSPQFVSIQGTSISYATNTPQEVIHLGDVFYLNIQNVWLASADAQGPWKVVQFVPEAVPAIVCAQLNVNPFDPYQLCALPWASGLSYTVWKSSE
jgi:hypothetical protein